MSRPRFTLVALNRINESWDETGESFLVEAHAEVGCEGQPGGEAFRVTVASPTMLVSEMSGRNEVESGRGYLFVSDYDEQTIMAWLQRLLDRCDASSWESLQVAVERHFDWIE